MGVDTGLDSMFYAAFFGVGLVVYGLVAIVFLDMTLREGDRKRLPWSSLRVAGIALCIVWPLALLISLAAALLSQGRQGEASLPRRVPTRRPLHS